MNNNRIVFARFVALLVLLALLFACLGYFATNFTTVHALSYDESVQIEYWDGFGDGYCMNPQTQLSMPNIHPVSCGKGDGNVQVVEQKKFDDAPRAISTQVVSTPVPTQLPATQATNPPATQETAVPTQISTNPPPTQATAAPTQIATEKPTKVPTAVATENPTQAPAEKVCKNKNSGKDGTPAECNAGIGQEKNQ